MLQFLCLQMFVYGGSAVPQGGVGDRHLVTVPQGVVGDRLPWGGERQGGGGVPLAQLYIPGGLFACEPCTSRRVCNAFVQATPGVGSINFWSNTIAWIREGGGGP